MRVNAWEIALLVWPFFIWSIYSLFAPDWPIYVFLTHLLEAQLPT